MRLAPALVAHWLATRGQFRPSEDALAAHARARGLIDVDPSRFLEELGSDPTLLAGAFRAAAPDARYPGRSEALVAVARALGARLPESEYVLPEDSLEDLLARVRALEGQRLLLRGAAGHKGRVGDGVESLLVGKRRTGKVADHPAAEIKSVPVQGERVVERVKLGVVSERSNPLDKCTRVLFVFVEKRGADHFVRGHHYEEFDHERWRRMWEIGFLVETAAGSTKHKTRGLYLVPKWFRERGIWPQTCATVGPRRTS
jgi:hypothetical protein